MNGMTTLLVVESIRRERYDASHDGRRTSPTRPHRPPPQDEPRSTWTELMRVYQLGFATRSG